jgi:hypothetical protein
MKGSGLYGVKLDKTLVRWHPEPGNPPFGNVLNKMEWFFHLDHFALSQKRNLRPYYRSPDLVPFFPVPRVTLIVFTWNDLVSFQRLIKSLENADYLGQRVNLRIYVDFDAKTHSEMIEFAESIKWVSLC